MLDSWAIILALAAVVGGVSLPTPPDSHANLPRASSNASLAPSASRWPAGLHLGVDYYPSQWPESMWEPDIAAMRDLNISYVRINEFDWAILEPTEGNYDFSVLDKTLDLFEQYGLKAVIGTPTASPPDWLTQDYDIAFVDVTNSTYVFGSRRYYSFSSFDYREQSQKITQVLAERYGTNPNVVGWQIDNELGCHSTVRTYDHNAIARFRTWLQDKYGTIEAMNAAQGRVFWSNQYASFDQVLPPYHEVYTTNDRYTLDWYEFSSDMVIDFAKEQVAILRQYAPTQAVTTNFMMGFTDFDHHKFARETGIDLAFFDEYPLAEYSAYFTWVPAAAMATTLRTGQPDWQALHHALYRGVAGAAYGATAGPFGVMEMQPGVLNWNTYRVSPLEGMVRLWTLEAYAASGDAVSYFRWRQVPYAQEQTLSGLHISDGSQDEGFFEAQNVVFNDLPTLREELALNTSSSSSNTSSSSSSSEDVAYEPQADVALVFDYNSYWTWAIEPYSGSWDPSSATNADPNMGYFDLVYKFYIALRRLGLSIDVIGPDQALTGYRLVVIPSMPIIPDAFNAALASYTDGGSLVFGPRSSALTANFSYAPGIQPAAGPLRDNLPLRVTRIETPPDYAASGIAYGGVTYNISLWEEWVDCARDNTTSRATVTSTSAHRYGKPAACAATSSSSSGGWHYLGFNPPLDFLVAYLADVAAGAGVQDLLGQTPSASNDLGDSLRLLRRGDLLWAFNYGTEAVAAPEAAGGAQVVIGTEGDIPAAGVVVWKLSS